MAPVAAGLIGLLMAVGAAVSFAPAKAEAGYTMHTDPDGSVTVTFRALADTQAATRDLQSIGVDAVVVTLAQPGSCATTPGGTPLDVRPGSIFAVRFPESNPNAAWVGDDVTTQWAGGTITIDPTEIPPTASLFILLQYDNGELSGLTSGLVGHPAPTCWEGIVFDPEELDGYPSTGGTPSPSPS